MKIRLKTETNFDAAHQLKLDYESKCKNLHGHEWRVIIWVEGNIKQLNNNGMLIDFVNLKKIINQYDHQNLNQLEDFKTKNPTAENICLIIFSKLKHLRDDLNFKVRVYESKNSFAEVGDIDES